MKGGLREFENYPEALDTYPATPAIYTVLFVNFLSFQISFAFLLFGSPSI